jgi:hypothetical protein
MLDIRLLFLPAEDTNNDGWLSSKSPPLTLLEGDEVLFFFKAMAEALRTNQSVMSG